ncbi:MAG: hypothetical protein WA364_04400, partial [Candidatus Nitrosopolaris sp.]
MLPDRTVLVSGGNGIGEGKINKIGKRTDTTAVTQSEIYNPVSKKWMIADSSQIERLYHSLAVLLPDGRVVAAGSDPDQAPLATSCPDKPSANSFGDNKSGIILDIYSPPYLFRVTRPVIEAVDEDLIYGANLNIQTFQGGSIKFAHLIKPMATTHSY